MPKLSKAQEAALQLVREGRVQYGIESPDMARRAAAKGRTGAFQWSVWLIDGNAAYGQQYRPFEWLSEHGLITIRHDLVPTHTVPERTKQYSRIAGGTEIKVIPEHEEPVDPGWRAPVELTTE